MATSLHYYNSKELHLITKKMILVCCFMLFLYACIMDTLRNAIIVNQSNEPVTITISYRKNSIDSIFKNDTNAIKAYLKEINAPTLANTVVLGIKDTFVVENVFNSVPDFGLIDQIQLTNNHDTLLLEHSTLKSLFIKFNSTVYTYKFVGFKEN